MKKIALFVFNGDPMCFVHVLLNALDMHGRDYRCRVVIEGAATQLIPNMASTDHPLNKLWEKTKEAGLVAGACKACCQKMGALDAARDQGIERLVGLNGHPSMTQFMEGGYDVMTF